MAPEEAKPGQSIGPRDQNQGRNFILRDSPKDELEEIHKHRGLQLKLGRYRIPPSQERPAA